MRLTNLIAHVEGAKLFGNDRDIKGISLDSRQIEPAFLFIAVRGTNKNGQGFIPAALEQGACAVLTTSEITAMDLPDGIALVTVPNIRKALCGIAATFYPRMPSQIAAVTGTSGKTSTVQFVRQMWLAAGHKAASLGTLGIIAPDIERYGALTTPDPLTLHKILNEISTSGVTHLAMEASSHGIEFNRLDNVSINVAAFTNLSRDHLDYHETMEKYLAAKMRLFTELLDKNGVAVINADIPEYDALKKTCDAHKIKTLTFGHQGHDIKIHKVTPEPKGQRLTFVCLGKEYEIMLPLIGSFQAVNAFCALAITLASGEKAEPMIAAMEKLAPVPGRLELIGTASNGGHVFVDYAHKPAALENVLLAMRPHVSAHDNAKLHVIFGCGGNRDKGKRAIMGDIATRLADKVIVTDDNPRYEEAAQIRQEILAGCQNSADLREIGDRRSAIETGIKALAKDDILIIAGKGHEEGQTIKDETLPFNDAACAKEIMGIGDQGSGGRNN